MPVIEYRRGERFDRVITGKNEDRRHSNVLVKLNTHTQKTAVSMPVPSITTGLPQDRSLADALRHAVEESARKSENATLRDVFGGAKDAANRSREEAAEIWGNVASQSRKGTKPSWIVMAIYAFIAFQVLRAIFG